MDLMVQYVPQNLQEASLFTGSFHLEDPQRGHVLGRSEERVFQ